MRKYYFLASALPSLRIGSPSDLSFSDFIFDAVTNLSAEDLRGVGVIRRYYDLQNLRLWIEHEQAGEALETDLDIHGNFDLPALEEAVMTRTGFPEYVYDFLDRYERRDERLKNFSALYAAYFTEESKVATGFLKGYLLFEREWRLVLSAFRAKVLGRDVAVELQFEDPDDDLVGQILAQRDGDRYEPPSDFHELRDLFEEYRNNPLALYQALCVFRFDRIEEMLETDMFTINRILGFMAQLIIVEEWMELDQKKGLQIVDTIVKDAS